MPGWDLAKLRLFSWCALGRMYMKCIVVYILCMSRSGVDRARLSSSERELLALVSRAAFANPFGAERWELDAQVAEVPPDTPDIVARVVAKAQGVLDAHAPVDLRAFGPADAELVEHAVLFVAFHRFADAFDALIAEQATQEAPRPFPAHEEIGAFLVERGLGRSRVERALELFYQMRRAYHFIATSLVGGSTSMRRLREALWNQVFTKDVRRYERHLWNRMEDFATILTGETGTGKGAAAAAIGRSGFIAWRGDRFETSFDPMFVPVNISELPGTLLESALFGHEKGAFTGAIARHEGVFARSLPHGTIFLDEIGEVSLPAQVKLLRVLQERTFTPLGAGKSRRFEGRVVAATHRSLAELRAQGRFRDDFYYRLCSDRVELPTLRQRLEEDPSELDSLVATVVARIVGSADRGLIAEVREAIARDVSPGHRWPGNVRELEQCVRRVLLTGRCEPDEEVAFEESPVECFWAQARAGRLEAKELLAGYCALLHERLGTYEAVAQVTGLDRRTAKKNVLAGRQGLEADDPPTRLR